MKSFSFKKKTETSEERVDRTISELRHDIEKRRKRQREEKRRKKEERKLSGELVDPTRKIKGPLPGRRRGTPYVVDWSAVDKLFHIQCTIHEVAGFLGMSTDTLSRRCKQDHGMSLAKYKTLKSSGGRASLRRKQWLLADKNTAMAIFLGKQYLEQAEKVETRSKASHEIVRLDQLGDGDLDQLESILSKVADQVGDTDELPATK